MSLTLTIPDEMARDARAIARDSGDTVEGLLLRALQAHFPPLPPDLKAEFDAWEQASDEDSADQWESTG